MGYLDNSSITVDAILTKRGRELLARNDGSFKITQFALADDEIDYTLFNESHPNGTQYSGEAIENMPLIEAIPDENNIMRHKLITLERGTSQLPFINLGLNIITLAIGGRTKISPTTINYNGVTTGQKEPSGYRFTIADRRLLTSFVGGGTPGNSKTLSNFSTTNVSETVVGSSVSMNAIIANTLFGSHSKLLTTLTIEGRDTGARLTIPVEISKNQSTTTAAASLGTPSANI